MTSTDPPAGPSPAPASATTDGRRVRKGYVTSYGGERICSETACTTVLSIYNAGASCSCHSAIGGARSPDPHPVASED